MGGKKLVLSIFFGLGFLVLLESFFIVNQTQQALVLMFGDIRRVEQEPGLKWKLPFVENVEFFDKRLLEFNAQPAEFITKDHIRNVEERVVIDAFVRYRITDPVRFFQSVKNEFNLDTRLNSIVVSSMREILARYSLSDLLSDKRPQIMSEIQAAVNEKATTSALEDAGEDETVAEERARQRRANNGFGIEVADVRIMRADLPSDISQATYERMRKNFTKEAQRFRAEGEERALEIRSNAEREKVEILAEAQKKSETIRGEGDNVAARTYADAFSKDPAFFEFYRSMQAYKKSLSKDDTTLILSPNSEFLKQLD